MRLTGLATLFLTHLVEEQAKFDSMPSGPTATRPTFQTITSPTGRDQPESAAGYRASVAPG